ncbi:MAG TPA: type II toxin-antitoxin system Phd/YefM family antitoxin [Kofleriaceae bacterium]|jgi:prevent-host-death family protein|nr:type II toxin-antitoxin system Phd/YefM family antitoxin [Kofleriaceae bacterium]
MGKAVYRSRASAPYASWTSQSPASRASEPYASRAEEAAGPRYRAESQAFQTAEDIIPIAELKANMSEIVRQLDARPRPLVVTLNGKPAAVVMSPKEYDRLAYQSRFIDSVAAGLADVQAGRTYDGEEAVAELLGELGVKKPRRSRSAK